MRKIFFYPFLMVLLLCFPSAGFSQVVIVMVDPVNTKTMYEGNNIHEAGFNMLKKNQEEILHLQTHISFYTNMMLNRETEKMNTLLSIDDFFTGNTEWQEHFMARMDTTRANLGHIEVLIEEFPKTCKLALVHKRLTEDLDDAQKKYDQAMGKSGLENLMRNDERNHLAILAEDQLEQVAWLVRELFNTIPQAREKIMDENI